jgi:hypothetical protein
MVSNEPTRHRLGSNKPSLYRTQGGSTFSTVRLRTRVTRGVGGSRKAALAMAYKLLDAAQARWHKIAARELVPLVRAGATFIDGKLQERRAAESQPGTPPVLSQKTKGSVLCRVALWGPRRLAPNLARISIRLDHNVHPRANAETPTFW